MHCTTTSTPTLPLPADISDIPRLALKAMPPRSPRTRTPERRRDSGSVGAGGGVGAGGPAGQSVYAIGPCGRWVWKTHRRCTDGVVPWDVQALNTEPTMLHWKSGAEYVTAVRPGLYEVRFAIWLRATVGASCAIILRCADFAWVLLQRAAGGGRACQRRPYPDSTVSEVHVFARWGVSWLTTLSLCLSDSGSTSAVTHHIHPAGSIAGTTVLQFVTLPPRAEIAVRVGGDVPAQAFLNVRKL